jgi:hypothetical protein
MMGTPYFGWDFVEIHKVVDDFGLVISLGASDIAKYLSSNGSITGRG